MPLLRCGNRLNTYPSWRPERSDRRSVVSSYRLVCSVHGSLTSARISLAPPRHHAVLLYLHVSAIDSDSVLREPGVTVMYGVNYLIYYTSDAEVDGEKVCLFS